MALSDQRRPCISFDAAHDISPAVVGQQISCQLCLTLAGLIAALRLRQDKIYSMLQETGEHDFSQHFPCHREKGDATTVATFCLVTFLLVYKDNVDIFSLLLKTLGGTAVNNEIVQRLMYTHCT